MKNRLSASIWLTLLLAFFCENAYAQEPTDRALLLHHVKNIPLPDSAFAAATYPLSFKPEVIATANLGDDATRIFVPVIMSSRVGKGKLLILGSNAYLNQPLLDSADVQQLLLNIFTWTKQGRGAKTGLIGSSDAFQKWLVQKNFSPQIITNSNIAPDISVLFCNEDIENKEQLRNIRSFMEAGGCLVLASPLFNRFQASGSSKYTLMLQTLLYPADLYHVANFAYPASNKNQLLLDSVPRYVNLHHILEDIRNNHYANYIKDKSDIVPSVILNLSINTKDSVSAPAAYDSIMRMFNLADTSRMISLTRETPLYKSDWKKYLTYLLQCAYRSTLAEKDSSYIDPEIRNFPGTVPSSAKKVTKTMTITPLHNNNDLEEPDSSFKRWYSTGLYAPAGARVKVMLSAKDTLRKIEAQIGAHNDPLIHLDEINRTPYNLATSISLRKDTTAIHSSFGGLIYIKIPDTDKGLPFRVTISGAVDAPYFQLGKTTRSAWQKTLRNAPAPWAELATDKLILTVPSSRIRNLNDPEKLMRFWDSIMDADADLAIIPRKRRHPERIIIDRSVAYGYMYTIPERIMAPDDESCVLMLNVDSLHKKGSWGHFHELGHRHQFWGIDHDELGEVTVNLYTMYAFDKVLGKGLYNHEAISSRPAVREKIQTYITSKQTYEDLSKDPFLYLSIFIPIIDEMGWQPVLNLHKDFRAVLTATPDRHKLEPDNDKRRNAFFIALCKATRKNLTRYLELFKIPVTEALKKEAAKYPEWIPHYFMDPSVPPDTTQHR